MNVRTPAVNPNNKRSRGCEQLKKGQINRSVANYYYCLYYNIFDLHPLTYNITGKISGAYSRRWDSNPAFPDYEPNVLLSDLDHEACYIQQVP